MLGFCEVVGNTVRLVGEFDMANAEDLADVLASLNGAVLVDCSDVEFFDSSALNAVIRANRDLEPSGGCVRLVNVTDSLAKILAMTGLEFLAVPREPVKTNEDPTGDLESV